MPKQKTQSMQHQNLLIAGAVAAAVGGGIYWYAVSSEPDVPMIDVRSGVEQSKPATTKNGVTPAGDQTQLRGKNVLQVGPQKPGNSLIIDQLNLVNPGYVVVYQADSKGQAGKLVAASPLLKAGSSEDLVVKATLTPSTTYVVMLRDDDGDGKFNASKDMVLNNATGKPVVQNITTSAK